MYRFVNGYLNNQVEYMQTIIIWVQYIANGKNSTGAFKRLLSCHTFELRQSPRTQCQQLSTYYSTRVHLNLA